MARVRLTPLVGLEPVQPSAAPAEFVAGFVQAEARAQAHGHQAAGEPPFGDSCAVAGFVAHGTSRWVSSSSPIIESVQHEYIRHEWVATLDLAIVGTPVRRPGGGGICASQILALVNSGRGSVKEGLLVADDAYVA